MKVIHSVFTKVYMSQSDRAQMYTYHKVTARLES